VETVVDSKQEPLSAPAILTMVAGQLDLGGVTKEAALLGLAHEVAMPDVDQVQVGNTVFIGHRGKGKSKNKIVGRAFNVDTARNFVNNYIKYLTVLRRKGITHYSIDFKGEDLVPVAKAVGKRLPELGMRGSMAKFKDNTGYRVYFLLQPKTEKVAA
tara:strand:- start:324 stop:794 length:471 start_codon:yes stop_codon:yes gene_type:complete